MTLTDGFELGIIFTQSHYLHRLSCENIGMINCEIQLWEWVC